MPTPAYMTVEGATQGNITQGAFTEESVGNIWQEGHEDEVLIQAFNHSVMIPRDPQSGQPSGLRTHRPVTVTKIFDKASPLMYQALCNGELLPKVEIKWYRTAPSGVQEHYFTIKLTDAICVDIQSYMPNCQDPANQSFTHLEDVSFSYRSIEWTHEVASTTGSDDWRKAKA
jgi:type VI secretion system secreted protein Hcp